MKATRKLRACAAFLLSAALTASTSRTPAYGDVGELHLAADLSRAIGTNPAGVPIFAAGDVVRLEVYVVLKDDDGNGFSHQGLAGFTWDLITNTGIKQNVMKPALTHTGDTARTNHEVWLETRDGAYFVGGLGFELYGGGHAADNGNVYGPGLVMWVEWRADVSESPGLQPFALHGVGFGSPPGTDVGGTPVGNRDKWYLMETQLNIPPTPGIYQVRVVPGVCNVIRKGKDLSTDIVDGFHDGLQNLVGETFTFQAGAGAPPAGYAPDAVLSASATYGGTPLTIEFDGRDSTDFNGGELRFEWDLGDGSPIETTSSVTHTYVAAGYYNARLRVTDEEGLTDVDEQLIAVGVNAPPSAVAVADVRYGTAPLIVKFDGTRSTDPEGDSLIYFWAFGDGGAAFGPTPSHTFDVYGSYDVTLTVTDPEGLTGLASVNVLLANQAPAVGFAMSAIVGEAPLIVDFDGTESFDPDGDPITYIWDFGDGESATGPSARHLYRTPGVYNVVLDVSDDKGNSRSVGRSLRVLLPDGRVVIPQANNKIPSVGLSAGPTKGPAPLTVTFGLSGADPDGDEVSVILDPGNGELISNLSPGQTATYTYTVEGDYTAEAMSFDGRGGTAKTYVAVSVQAPAAVAPPSNRSSRGICGAGVAQISVPAMAVGLLLFAARRRR